MRIISIQPGHNATAGFFENGKCKFILHEEKFTNIKNHFGWPENSLSFLSKQIDFNKIDYFVFGSRGHLLSATPSNKKDHFETLGSSNLRKIWDLFSYTILGKSLSTEIKNFILYKKISPKARESIENWLFETYKIPKEKLFYFDHHLCHCLTPFYFYGLDKEKEKILLISMDGAGDYAFSKIYLYDPKKFCLELIAESPYNSSLGVLYSKMTEFLGMKVNEHEHKVMGLAAYVLNERYFNHIYEKLSKLIWVDYKTLTFKSKFDPNLAHLYFKKHFSFERFDNLAAAIQKFTEDLTLKWIKAIINKTKIKKIALSGGVFMNVKMNQKILELDEIEKIYFQPSAGDESLVIGAACKLFLEKQVKLSPIKTMYLGLSYSDKYIKDFLEKHRYFRKYKISYFKHGLEKEIAKLLADFKIVGLFRGKGEWGARSLCNRAILANASDLKSFYEVNDAIKMRDFWMPFAPTIKDDWAEKYIKDWKKIKEKAFDSTKYMILTFNSTPLAQNHLRAAIHQKDKTLRPQIVSKNDNPFLYSLLNHYEKLTKMGGFLNTSLNLHGFPLVGTLEQALFTFENSNLKYLVLENFLIEK